MQQIRLIFKIYLLNRSYYKASWSVGSSSILTHFSINTKIHLQNCEINNVREVEIKTKYDYYFLNLMLSK